MMFRRGLMAAALGMQCVAAPALAEEDAPRDVEEVVVTARAQKLYRTEEVSVGKLPTEPLAASQTVQVINAELIHDLGARNAQDLYRNISGVSFFSYAGVTARGFRQEEIFFDGLRGDPYAGFSVPQLFNIERLEFLKGPAGMLYGPGAPGGLFNYVTKKPTEVFAAKASTVVGTGSRYGGSVEATGALPVEGLSARAGVFYEDRDTPRRNAGDKALILDTGLKYAFDLGEVTLQATRYEQDLDANRLRGVPVDASGRFLTSRRWNHNEPTDFLNFEANVLQALATLRPTDSLTLSGGVRHTEALETQQYHEPQGLFDSDGDGLVDATTRQFRDQIRKQQNWSVGVNGVWSGALAGVDSRVLFGGDWFKQEASLDNRSKTGLRTAQAGSPPPLSLFDPAYGLVSTSTYALGPFVRTYTDQKRAGGYLLYEATVGPLIGTVGARYDDFEDRSGATTFSDSALTWRTGLVYRIRPDVSFYGQWAQSFEPQAATSQTPLAGGPFAPTEGEMFEGGVKTELMGGRLQTTAVAYHITRTNILQADPRGDVDGDGVNDQIAFGEIVSKGVELDVAADLTPNWVLTAAYAYNDTRITKDNGRTVLTNAVGDRFANAPKHTLGFWTRYQFPELGLAVAFGGDYVDTRVSMSGQKVRPYTIFDASLIYTRGPWEALLRINNLLDETYAASGFIDRTGHFPGEPRSAFLQLSRQW
ncbi:TonB-dependent siderophore receptor [Phenylobacterium sp. LjRoot225]|uniref:TonB-dependent siderophore receptor n=1 Tax=Phenylobacterium sp. LjRoot225 TaxID=3342285 RepID=UPI003ECD7F94